MISGLPTPFYLCRLSRGKRVLYTPWLSGTARGLLRHDILDTTSTAACFANQTPSSETIGALGLHDTSTVADIAFRNALRRGKFARPFAFVAFGWDGASALALGAVNLAFTIADCAGQK